MCDAIHPHTSFSFYVWHDLSSFSYHFFLFSFFLTLYLSICAMRSIYTLPHHFMCDITHPAVALFFLLFSWSDVTHKTMSSKRDDHIKWCHQKMMKMMTSLIQPLPFSSFCFPSWHFIQVYVRCEIHTHTCSFLPLLCDIIHSNIPLIPLPLFHAYHGEVGGWGRIPFSRNFMKPTPRRKWYLTTGRRFH